MMRGARRIWWRSAADRLGSFAKRWHASRSSQDTRCKSPTGTAVIALSSYDRKWAQIEVPRNNSGDDPSGAPQALCKAPALTALVLYEGSCMR